MQGSSQNVKARLNMNNLLEDLEDLSQEGENYNWLGNAFNDNDSDNDFNTLYGNDDIDNDSDDEDMNDSLLNKERNTFFSENEQPFSFRVECNARRNCCLLEVYFKKAGPALSDRQRYFIINKSDRESAIIA